jgi:hypothetical protein
MRPDPRASASTSGHYVIGSGSSPCGASSFLLPMEATRLRFLLPLSLLLLLVSVLDASARNEENARALMALKCALDPAGRVLGSWDPSGDPCSDSYDGVECDRTGHVTVISLQGCGLSGSLPPAVAGLRRLQGLYLHYNGIRGVIPREIGKLSELADLYLDVNHLAGPVPVEIAAMASLHGEFFLDSAAFTLVGCLVPRCKVGGR